VDADNWLGENDNFYPTEGNEPLVNIIKPMIKPRSSAIISINRIGVIPMPELSVSSSSG